MSLLERILIAIIAVLFVAALVGWLKYDIERTTRSSPAARGEVIREPPTIPALLGRSATGGGFHEGKPA